MTTATLTKPQPIADIVKAKGERVNFDAGDWLYDATHDIFEPYACEDDNCPNRPAWDRARSDLFEQLARELDKHVEDMAKWLVVTTTRALEAYAAEWPDAPRKSLAAGA